MKYLVLFLLIAFLPFTSFAQKGSKSKRIQFEANSLFGWGGAQSASDTSSPSIGTFNLGLGVGVNIKKFTIGLSYDYRMLTQFSDVDPSVGNRRGTFISPMSIFLRLNFEKIRFGFQLVNSGTYELLNITADGKKVKYTNPSGFRFDLIFKKIKKIIPMIYFESVSFSGKEIDGISATTNGNLNYSNYGAGIKYEF